MGGVEEAEGAPEEYLESPEYRASLHRLAEECHVATHYWGQAGNHVTVADDVIAEVLAALGVDASDQGAIERSWEAIRVREWRRVLPPVFVTWSGEERRLWVHVPHGEQVRAWIRLEDGTTRELQQWQWWVDPVEVDGVLTGEASFGIPADVPIGWHLIGAESPSVQATCPLAVAPARLDPSSIIGDRQWGLMTQIYSWPSRDSWGVGDSVDLATLATWSHREHGAGFILVNPGHAPVPGVPSPYLPSSRRGWNPMLIRPEAIVEYSALSATDRARVQGCRERATVDLHSAGALARIDRDRIWPELQQALRIVFDAGRSASREADFEDFCQRRAVVDIARWSVLAERFGTDYRTWPRALQDANSDEVATFVAENSKNVRFHMWLQWIAAGQLSAVQQQCRSVGMPIGVISDLAVGVHPGGADAWSLASVMASGVGVGAPPDMYNQRGQNWDQPPWRPEALAQAHFEPFREVLQAALQGAGGVRIDHILGLFRMWWIPEGRPATEGTYVGFDHDALLAIVCLEAHRAGAIVIGEDLGTVEPWVQHELSRRGILGTVISWFEKDEQGQPLAIEDWRPAALASVTVHDLPPTAGYLAGEHVRIRAELGLLEGASQDEWAAAAAERQAWAGLLRSRGYLDHEANLDSPEGREQMVIALHRALADSPCALLGVAAADVIGDRRAQNQPGTDREYPNWRMPMADRDGTPVMLDEFLADTPGLAGQIANAVHSHIDT